MTRAGLDLGVMIASLALAVASVCPDAISKAGRTALDVLRPRSAEAVAIDTTGRDRIASFSPGARLLGVVDTQMSRLEVFSRNLTMPETEKADASQAVALSPWRSAVRTAPDLGPTDRRALAIEIQKELRRIGCYAGEIDGRWNGSSQRAVATFVDRVNASLPTAAPDLVLLTLARAQPAGTCGASCPAGQELDEQDRCVPSAIVAQSSRRRHQSDDVQVAQSVKRKALVVASAELEPLAARGEPLPGAMYAGARTASDGSVMGPTGYETTGTGRLATQGPSTPDGWAAEIIMPAGAGATGRSLQVAEITPPAASTDTDRAPSVVRRAAVTTPAAVVVRRSADVDGAARRRAKVVATVERAARQSGYRAVKHLFENPLGRL